MAQDAQEELQSNVQQVVAIEKQMQDVQVTITRLENTNEGRRASDAGSVQQCSAGTTGSACC